MAKKRIKGLMHLLETISSLRGKTYLMLSELIDNSISSWIDELKLNEVEVYKKANIDRRLFSKMRSNLNYKPSKETALAFVFSLKLNIKQARSFIRKAGYDLSDDMNFDLIIRYCIEHEIYDIFMVNEILFNFEEKLLG